MQLVDFSGQWLILIFYPRDLSFVCPTELTAFSARAADFIQRGCRLLGISVDTIELQYRRHREGIWASRPGLLPDFELNTLRMPLSAGLDAPRECDWCERLDRMRAGIECKTFDVALIGAGGMSLPLACHAKRMGAIGFHMGGATQLLFGIRGRRWDNYEDINCFFNDSWTRPSAAETPATATLVEDGCYW